MTIRFSEELIDRLAEAGFTAEHVEALEALDLTQLRSVVERLPTLGPVFDAGALLGIGPAATDVPRGKPGVITVIVPGPITVLSLRDSEIGQRFVFHKKFEQFGWSRVPIDGGVYRVTLPVESYYNRWFDRAYIGVVIGMVTLLCMRKAGYHDPLDGGLASCIERNHNSDRVNLSWLDDKLVVV